jgi:hypothetical protein
MKLIYFIFLSYRLYLNSNNRIEIIFLSNLFDVLQILESLNYLNLIQINLKENNKGDCSLWATFGWPSQLELAAHG